MKRTMKKACALAAPLALAALFATSCSDYDNGYDEVSVRYEQEFLNKFGYIDPEQDWNLVGQLAQEGGVGYVTRAGGAPSFERWQEGRTWERPHDIIESERDYVLQYLQEHPNGGYKTLNIDTYIIQVVGGSHHSYDGDTPDNNGHLQTVADATTEMNYCVINGFFTQYNNAHEMNSEDPILIKNVRATKASFHDSYGSTYENNYAFYLITFPNEEKYGYMAGKTGCYLCYDFETYKSSESWGVSPDGKYDDWVIKLTPSDGSTIIPGDEPGTSTKTEIIDEGLLVCEDLGGYDFDFNDIVLKLQHIRTTEDNNVTNTFRITAMAAGGTLPSYIYYRTSPADYNLQPMIGYNQNEIHELLGGSVPDILNAHTFDGEGASWDITLTTLPSDMNSNEGYASYAFRKGLVVVKVEDKTEITSIKSGYNDNPNTNYERPSVPQMMFLPIEFQWPQENVFIGDAYADTNHDNFTAWVNDKSRNTWYKYPTGKITQRNVQPNQPSGGNGNNSDDNGEYGAQIDKVGDNVYNIQDVLDIIGNKEYATITIVTPSSNAYCNLIAARDGGSAWDKSQNYACNFNEDGTYTTISVPRSFFIDLQNANYSQFYVQCSHSVTVLYVK